MTTSFPLFNITLPGPKWSLTVLFVLSLIQFAHPQSTRLSPGFNAQECDELLRLNFAFNDTSGNTFNNFQKGYYLLHRSESLGLDNAYDLWKKGDSTTVILLRGTTADPRSILADFYSAMLPAKGEIGISSGTKFTYKLAQDEKAAVHAGFLIGFSYIAENLRPRIDSLYLAGQKDFLISGHSQGGALAFLLSAWLNHLKADGTFPEMNIKTYSSASPKVGNSYFAYDYDNMTREGWAFSVVNAEDAIPEMPFTTQQADVDMNKPNPIYAMMDSFNKLPFFKRILLKGAFNKMIKNAEKSSKSYQKYLGTTVHGLIRSFLPDLGIPEYSKSFNFMRPGISITFLSTEQYWKKFANEKSFFHHGIIPYRFLLREYYSEVQPMSQPEEAYLLEADYN